MTIVLGAQSFGRRLHAQGFTLVELLVAITVAAVLLTIAIPSFNYVIQSNTLSTAANDLIFNLSYARSVSGKQGNETFVCVNSDCPVCDDSDCRPDPSTPPPVGVLHVGVPSLSSGLVQSQFGSDPSVEGPALVYDYQGIAHTTASPSPYSGLVRDIYTTRISSNNHRCVYMVAGAALSTCTDSADCGTGAPNASCK